MKNILYIVLVLIVMQGCTKPDPLLPAPTNTSPEFFIKGQKNVTDSLNMTAGVGGMYMYSRWEQSKYTAQDSAYQFQAIMAPAGCITCNPKFNIVIFDSGKTTAGQKSYIDNFVIPGNFQFINNAIVKAGVYIGWTSNTGTTYLSRKFNLQPTGSFFQVVSAVNYKDNNGIKTKKISVKFSARCYNTTTDYVDFKNMEAVVVIGYP